MNSWDRGLIIWLLLCGLAVGCLVIVAGDAAAVERPTDPGPYSVGYFDVTLNVTDVGETRMVDCRYYYPATSSGEGSDPDPTGAPYPTIIYHVFYDGSMIIKSTREDDRERIDFIVSHGIIVLTFTPFRWGMVPGRSYYNDLLYHTDNFDTNGTSPLYGMVKKDSYGAAGDYWGGTFSYINVCYIDRITAVHSLGPFFPINHTEYHDDATNAWNSRERAWMIQKGGAYTANKGYLLTEYDLITTDKIMVTIPGGDQRGPFRIDLMVAFFHYYLGGNDDYETYLFGEEATNEVYTGQIRMKYTRDDGIEVVFNPVFTVDVPNSVYMDEDITLEVTWERYVLLDHPTLVHEWYVGDESEPYVTSTTNPNMTITITDPGEYNYVRYKYKIGLITLKSDIARIIVKNIWPVADAGPNRTIFQDELFELNGSRSYDTPSDLDTLEYNWTFGGEQTEWSTDPTYQVDTSLIRKFTAHLTVRDRHWKFTQDPVTINIINKPPEARVGADMTSLEDEVVELTGLGIDTVSDADTLKFRWVFGDGAASQWSVSPGTNHTYTQQDTYTVTFQVKDTKGALNISTLSVTVSNVAPTAGIDLPKDGAEADVDTKVTFTGWGRDALSDSVSLWYTWDFGDGRTAEGAVVSHTYKEAGRYTVTLTVEDDDGATAVVTHTLTIEAGPGLDGPQVFTVTVGFLAILVLAIIAATESGKYWLGLLSAPLFMKTKDVLDNKTRHALLGIIVTNLGIHYSAIKEEFKLANGAAAHHLYVLEREGFIRSVRDGKLKRFYLADVKVPEDVGRSPEGTRDAIVELVRERPGISQLEVMEELELDRNEASYYLRNLVKEDRLKAGKEGRFTVYTVNGRK